MKVRPKIQSIYEQYFHHNLVRLVSLEDLQGNEHLYLNNTEAIATPEAKQMPFYTEAKFLQNDIYQVPTGFCKNLNQVIYCAQHNILLTKSRQIISESISTQKDPEQFSLRALYSRNIEQLSGICSTIRSHKNGYYHTLVDNLPRLYLLAQQSQQSQQRIKLLFSERLNKVESFFLKKLLPENLKINILDQQKSYLAKDFVFPSFLSRRFAGYLPERYLNWFLPKVTPQRPRNKVNRIFISRIKTNKGHLRCILNEEELFEQLKKYGFQKYVLEKLSLEEQIELFYDAEFVVAAHGAGLTNIIFSRGIKVIELFPTQFMIPHYYYLSKSINATYRYWCADQPGRNNNFKVDIQAILKVVIGLDKQITSPTS